MAKIEYSLFRAKFIKPRQDSFLYTNKTPQELFIDALKARPSSEKKSGYRWHIGNLRYFSATTGYFAVGRTTNSTIEKFDDESGNFIEEELEQSPYTHCVFDSSIGLIGIAKKTILAQSTKSIALRIEQLLSTYRVIHENQIVVEVAPIPNPDGFLSLLDSAYKVTSFSATFRGPNPFDADRYFQKPLANYLLMANGVKGKAQIQGDDLNRNVLQEVTRSSAATGNEASAKIVKEKAQKPVSINLKGDPLKASYDEEKYSHEEILADLNKLYDRVRHDQRS